MNTLEKLVLLILLFITLPITIPLLVILVWGVGGIIVGLISSIIFFVYLYPVPIVILLCIMCGLLIRYRKIKLNQ